MTSEDQANRNGINRRHFLELAGTSVLALTVGAGTALANQDDLRTEAKQYIASKTGASIEDLIVVNEATVEYQLLDERYYEAKIRNQDTHQPYRAFLNGDGNSVDAERVEARAPCV